MRAIISTMLISVAPTALAMRGHDGQNMEMNVENEVLENITKPKDIDLSVEDPGLKAFQLWAIGGDGEGEQPNCAACNLLFTSLLAGVEKAGKSHAIKYLKESRWDLDTTTLEVDLGVENLYGEIASSSRIPVAFKLNEHIKFAFHAPNGKTDDMQVTVDGLETVPSAQGLALYKKIMETDSKLGEACCANGPCTEADADCLGNEINIGGTYLDKNYFKGDKMKNDKGKISAVLKTMYDSVFYRKAIGGRWPAIFYTMIAAAPNKINSFTFTQANELKSSEVSATTEEIPNTEHTKYHLRLKSMKMGESQLEQAGAFISIAEKAAPSGMNFAKMLAYGNGFTNYGAGDVGKMAKLFRWCEGSKPSEDPQCADKSPGRLSWGQKLGETMK